MARLKGFEKLTNVDEALSIFFKAANLTPLTPERISLGDALERVTSENVVAPVNLPEFDRSAVDGYAIRAEDTFGISQVKPKTFKITQERSVSRDQAKQVWTGNPLPHGSNAVVMIEHTRKGDGCIVITSALTPRENVSRKGEDVQKRKVAIKKGTRLQPHHLGLLAALGINQVHATRKPKVSILSTGNELRELDQRPRSLQIVNSNRFILAGLCTELGAQPVYMGIAKDDEKEIGAKILEGLKQADAVITTGGTSVGAADLVTISVNKLGKPGIVVHGVAMRPGMPTALGIVKDKPIFVLSGYPVAAIVGFEVFARPSILRLQGVEAEPRPTIKAKLTKRIVGSLGRRVYLRVGAFEKGGEFFAEPIRTKGSGLLTSMTEANGFVVIPEDREGLDQNETVTVLMFSQLNIESA